MHIKKVLEYDYNYAKYIVSDGNNELKCVCMSVPLSDGIEPRIGLEITKICAFCVNELIINKITKEKDKKDSISKHLFNPLGYKLKGRVLNSNQSIIEVFNYKIDLGYDYPDGLGKDFKDGDYVEFSVDRLDCIIKD